MNKILTLFILFFANGLCSQTRVFPNPVNKLLQIANFQGTGMIYNMTGQEVLSFIARDVTVDFVDLQYLPFGSYQLVLGNVEGVRSNHLLIKQ